MPTDSPTPAPRKDAQTAAFAHELDNLVERFRAEYDITYATIIGCLHLKAHDLCVEAYPPPIE